MAGIWDKKAPTSAASSGGDIWGTKAPANNIWSQKSTRRDLMDSFNYYKKNYQDNPTGEGTREEIIRRLTLEHPEKAAQIKAMVYLEMPDAYKRTQKADGGYDFEMGGNKVNIDEVEKAYGIPKYQLLAGSKNPSDIKLAQSIQIDEQKKRAIEDIKNSNINEGLKEQFIKDIEKKSEMVKKGQRKLGVVERLFKPFAVTETGEAVYETKKDPNKNILMEWLGSGARRLQEFVTGYTSENPQEGYADVAALERGGKPEDYYWEGLAKDIALDPMTLLTLGTNKVFSKGGKEIFEQTVKTVAKNSMDNLTARGVQAVEKVVMKNARKQVMESFAQRALKDPDFAKQIYRGPGVFVGPTRKLSVKIPGSEKLGKIAEEGLITGTRKAVLDATEKIPGVGKYINKARETFGGLFDRDYGLTEYQRSLKQTHLDSLQGTTSQYLDYVGKLFKGTDTAVRERISEALEGGEKAISKLDNTVKVTESGLTLRNLAKTVQGEFSNILKEEQSRNLLSDGFKNYVTHIYNADAETVTNFMNKFRKGLNSTNKYGKERIFKTIKDAEAAGLNPEKDIAKVLAIRKVASLRSASNYDYLQTLAKEFGYNKKPEDKLGGFIKSMRKPRGRELSQSDKMVKESAVKKIKEMQAEQRALKNQYGNLVPYVGDKSVSGILLPKNIVKDLEQTRKYVSDEYVAGLVKVFDTTQNFFKGSVTAMFPAFHFRNATSNVLQNWLDIGVRSLNPKAHIEAYGLKRMDQLARKGNKPELFDKIARKSVKLGDNTYTMRELYDHASKNGILGGFYHTTEIGETAAGRIEGLSKKWYQSDPFKWGREAGSFIEDEARLTNFLGNIALGQDIKAAAKHTKQFLFDYENLSGFEKNVMKRVIPFYTFSRKNFALQLDQMGKKLGTYSTLGKVATSKAPNEEERAGISDFALENLLVRGGVDKLGRQEFFTGFGTPQEEVAQTIEDVSKLFAGETDFLSRTAFVPKTGAEFLMNKDFFTGKTVSEQTKLSPIEASIVEKFGGKVFEEEQDIYGPDGKPTGEKTKVLRTDNPYLLKLVRSLPSSRGTSAVSKLMDEKTPMEDKALRFFTNITKVPVDVDQQTYFRQKEIKDRLAELLKRGGTTPEKVQDNLISKGMESIKAGNNKGTNDTEISTLLYMQGLKNAGMDNFDSFFAKNPELDPTSPTFTGYELPKGTGYKWEDVSAALKDMKEMGGSKLPAMQALRMIDDTMYSKFFDQNPNLDPLSDKFQGFKKGGYSGKSSKKYKNSTKKGKKVSKSTKSPKISYAPKTLEGYIKASLKSARK